MPAESPSIFLDWQFWSAVVALAALVLSQFPPVLPRLRGGRMSMDVYGRVSVNHFLGNPQIQLLINLEHERGRAIKVRRMRVEIRRGQDAFSLPGQNFLEREDSTSINVLAPFTLGPGAGWRHITNFEGALEIADEKANRQIISNMRAHLREKYSALTPDEKSSNVQVIADPGLTSVATGLFQSRFKWKPGEYEIDVVAETDYPAQTVTRRLRFTLYETDTLDLKAQTKDYSKGFGVFLPLEVHGVQPSLLPR